MDDIARSTGASMQTLGILIHKYRYTYGWFPRRRVGMYENPRGKWKTHEKKLRRMDKTMWKKGFSIAEMSRRLKLSNSAVRQRVMVGRSVFGLFDRNDPERKKARERRGKSTDGDSSSKRGSLDRE